MNKKYTLILGAFTILGIVYLKKSELKNKISEAKKELHLLSNSLSDWLKKSNIVKQNTINLVNEINLANQTIKDLSVDIDKYQSQIQPIIKKITSN